MIEHSLIQFDHENGQKLKIIVFATRGGLDSVAKLAPSGAKTCISHGANLKLGVQTDRFATQLDPCSGDALTHSRRR